MQNTKQQILNETKKQFALFGESGISIRTIAHNLNIAQSVIYHHFKNKDEMLFEAFEQTRRELGRKRTSTLLSDSFKTNLHNRIQFQFDNAGDVTFLLKYYLHKRNTFNKNDQGFVPKTAYTHILEILNHANEKKEFNISDVEKEAKLITHTINGFILEYYPNAPKGKEKDDLINSITDFIYRATKFYEQKGGE